MPLHRNESASQKSLTFKNQSCFMKENYILSRERVTQMSSTTSPTPEMLFKGIGTRTKLNPPKGLNSQWAPKGSYRLEHMLEMVEKLPN